MLGNEPVSLGVSVFSLLFCDTHALVCKNNPSSVSDRYGDEKLRLSMAQERYPLREGGPGPSETMHRRVLAVSQQRAGM